LEDRAVPATTTYLWNGTQSNNFNQAANWTDVANGTHHAVPTATDTVIIQRSPHDPTMSQLHTIAGLQVNGGILTLSANLTDTGSFLQAGGSVAFGAAATRLNIAGNVTRTGGTFSGAAGTVALNGTAGQSVMDTTFTRFPNLLMSNGSTAGVTLPGGSNVRATTGTLNAGTTLTLLQGAQASFLSVSGTFTDNGKIVLNQLSANGGNPTSLVNVKGTLALGAASAFDLSVRSPAANAVYTFVTYGTHTGTWRTVTIHGNLPFGASASAGANALTVTLKAPGTVDTWTGRVNSNFANPANWSTGAVPGPADLAVIKSARNDPIVSASTTLGSLQMSGGLLTISAVLTVTGTFSQDAGFLSFSASANQLQIAGNVTRTGGVFLGTVGTVVLKGTTQSVTDTSAHPFGWNLVVNKGTTLTVLAGSVVGVGKDFTNNGTVKLSMASPAISMPLALGNNLIEGVGSVFNLTLGQTNSGLSYSFIAFGGTDPAGATFTTNAGTVTRNGHSITVTT
jgi:hypothetical protein